MRGSFSITHHVELLAGLGDRVDLAESGLQGGQRSHITEKELMLNRIMLLILDGSSEHGSHIWSKTVISIFKGIWLHRKSRQIFE